MQHTPGPWLVEPATENHGPYITNDLRNVTICDLYFLQSKGFYTHCEEEAEANARLIAAAPDLLEALTKTVDALDAVLDERGTVGYDDIVDAGRAVIAKAMRSPTRLSPELDDAAAQFGAAAKCLNDKLSGKSSEKGMGK